MKRRLDRLERAAAATGHPDLWIEYIDDWRDPGATSSVPGWARSLIADRASAAYADAPGAVRLAKVATGDDGRIRAEIRGSAYLVTPDGLAPAAGGLFGGTVTEGTA